MKQKKLTNTPWNISPILSCGLERHQAAMEAVHQFCQAALYQDSCEENIWLGFSLYLDSSSLLSYITYYTLLHVVYRWLDKLGVAALTNHSRVFRQDYIGGSYSLLDSSFNPLPVRHYMPQSLTLFPLFPHDVTMCVYIYTGLLVVGAAQEASGSECVECKWSTGRRETCQGIRTLC